MTENRKILGMTAAQIAILAGLGGVACLLFGLTGWLMLGGGFGLSRAPENTFVVPPAPTLVITATPPPLTETPTPVPYEQLIPDGWKQFKTELVEIWLPSSFKVAEKEPDEEMAASAANSSSSLYRMRVSVSYVPLVGDSLDEHLDAGLSQVDPQARLVERRKVSLNSTEAVRMMFEMRVETVDVNLLVYVMQDGGTVWFVLYVAQINEFYEKLPTFEQSIKTFRIVR